MTLWLFFVWGLGLACAGVWLLNGRSKGEAIVFVRDGRRLVLFAVLFVLIIGLLIFLVSQPSVKNDAWWPLILQTMFANLFASLPLMLFDRADYRNKPVPMNGAQRLKMRQRLIIMSVLGGLMVIGGIAASLQEDTWWAEGIHRVGFALLASGAVLGYRLKKTSTVKD